MTTIPAKHPPQEPTRSMVGRSSHRANEVIELPANQSETIRLQRRTQSGAARAGFRWQLSLG